jgi:hypothetical protein
VPIIINGGSRSGGAWWSRHLENEETNEQVQVIEYRHLSASTMRAAFYEMEALAAGTKCQNYFYQANINPRADEVLTPVQWREAVDTLEHNLGLTGQPRFIVQHEKEARVHQHVVWSRIDAENGVAISDSLTAQIHERTSRELEITFDLERGKSVLVPDRDFDRPDRRSKKWETFRGADTGIDPKVMKAELEAIRQRCDNGTSFRAALEESGAYVLARGDRRDYVIIDQFGDDHSLARRLDLRAAELRRFMADLDPSIVPSVDEAKTLQRERQAQAQIWDRDAANAAWEQSIQNAALGQGQPAVYGGAVPEQERDKPAARGPYAQLAPEASAPATEAKREVSPRRTADDIRAAFAATREVDAENALQEALTARGIGLAAVSPEEAYASERQAAFAREVGRRGRALSEGEIVAVDGKGNTYRLDERVTGEKQLEAEARLAGLDRAALPDLAAAKQAMREASRAAWSAKKDAERAEARIREPVTGVTAEIRTAFTLAPDSPDAARLKEALAARGVTLARATGAEAQASEAQAARYDAWKQYSAAQAGTSANGRYAELRPDGPQPERYSPRLAEGEIVAVDRRGFVHRLDERATGLHRGERDARLAGLEGLLDVTAAREAMRQAARGSWQAERERRRPPSRIETRIAECARMAALNGASIRVNSDGHRVRATEALADRLRPEAEQRTSYTVVHGAAAFGIRLEQAGLVIARVSEAEVAVLKALREQEQRVTEADPSGRAPGNRIDLCEGGDLVAVMRYGDICRINADKTGGAAGLLRALTTTGALEARQALQGERDARADVWLQHRADHAAWEAQRENAWANHQAVAGAERGAHHAAHQLEETIDAGLGVAGGLFRSASRLIENLLGFLVPAPRLTPLQSVLAARAAEERAEARDVADADHQAEAEHDWRIFEADRTREQENRAVELGLATVPPDRRSEHRRDDYERDRY